MIDRIAQVGSSWIYNHIPEADRKICGLAVTLLLMHKVREWADDYRYGFLKIEDNGEVAHRRSSWDKPPGYPGMLRMAQLTQLIYSVLLSSMFYFTKDLPLYPLPDCINKVPLPDFALRWLNSTRVICAVPLVLQCALMAADVRAPQGTLSARVHKVARRTSCVVETILHLRFYLACIAASTTFKFTACVSFNFWANLCDRGIRASANRILTLFALNKVASWAPLRPLWSRVEPFTPHFSPTMGVILALKNIKQCLANLRSEEAWAARFKELHDKRKTKTSKSGWDQNY